MQYKDYYKVLGVERNADQNAIKKTYRKLARQFHPDTNKGNKDAEEKFKEINEAYEVLGDADKRKVYDQLGSNYANYTQAGGDPRNYDWAQWARENARDTSRGTGAADGNAFNGRRSRTRVDEEADFSDFFSSIFGGGLSGDPFGGQRTNSQPRDVESPVPITLEEAYHGTKRIIQKQGEPDIEVTIPAGVKTGSRIRVRGQGMRNQRGQTGDLYLVVEVADNATYQRKDDDLYRDIAVDAFRAMLGGEQTVDTLGGKLVIKVPAGTSSGKRIRLRGRGMPKLNAKDEHGDLYLRLMLTVPANLSEEDRATLTTLAEKYSQPVNV